MLRENRSVLLIMLLAVPLAGELKFYPYNGDFRVSFGTPVFFFLLLWVRNIHPLVSGLLVGVSVVGFRVLLNGITLNFLTWQEAFRHHFPVFFYYLTYASLFHLTGIRRFYHRPFLIGVLGMFIEILASMVELLFRHVLTEMAVTQAILGHIVIAAFIRSFFVLGFFNLLILHQAVLAEEQQRKRNEQMLLLISGLYEESIHLKKSMQDCEEVTRTCYDLYRSLKNKNSDHRLNEEFAQTALKIAGQVHEIKKDSQRIYAALSEMISDRNVVDYISAEELGNIVIKSNKKYAHMLGKNIDFKFHLKGEHPFYHAYTALSLINNLVANSVEAIENTGMISLFINRNGQVVEFHVSDNGPGIPPKKRDLIFEHGFTTKYDISGKPSTGIGLSYVKEVVQNLGGELLLQNDPDHPETTFIIRLPIDSLAKRG